MKEFGKWCQKCGKRRESHMYYKKIKSKWLRICKECWEEQEKIRKQKV
jgi:hypothetical protein